MLSSIENQEYMRAAFKKLKECVSYESSGCNVQTERPLDEAYFPGLDKEFFAEQNKDQVVSREYRKKHKLDENDRSVPTIMVPQLWIWTEGDCMFSAFSQVGNMTPRNPGHYWKQIDKTSADLRIGLIIADQIDRFGQPQLDSTQFWDDDTHETSVVTNSQGIVLPNVHITRKSKRLATNSNNSLFAPPLDYFEMGVVRILSEVNEYLKKENLGKLSIDSEKEFLHDIADIRNELVMIQYVLDQQGDVLDPLIVYYNDETMKGIDEGKKFILEDWKRVAGAKKQLERYGKRVEKINGDAERIEKMVQNQLELKRTYSSIRDTRSSLILSTSVIGFTVITVIFTPLAFMASLFALPLEQLRKHQKKDGNDTYYETHYVKYWFGKHPAHIAPAWLKIANTLKVPLRVHHWAQP